MSKLRNVRTEINKMRKELEAKEAELRKEKLAPSIEAISEVLLNDEAVCNVLDGYSKDEIRVIAKHIVGNLGSIIAESGDDIEALRAKKKARAAKRKAAKESAEVLETVTEETVEPEAETAGTNTTGQTGWNQTSYQNQYGQY